MYPSQTSSASRAFVASSFVRHSSFTASTSTCKRLRSFHSLNPLSNNTINRRYTSYNRELRFTTRATAVSNPSPPVQSQSNGNTDLNNDNVSSNLNEYKAVKKQAPLIRFGLSLIEHWRLLIPGLIGGVIASICAVLEPPQFGRILGILSTIHHARLSPETALLIPQHKISLYYRILTIAITYMIEMFSTIAFISFLARAGDKAIRNLREKLFKVTLSNDIAYFDRIGRENVERAASVQLRIARQSFWDNLSEDRGLRAILEALFGVIMCLRLTGPMGIPVFCFLIPLISLSVARLGLQSGRLNAKVEGKEAEFLTFISERMRGLRTLKAFGAESKESNDLKSFLNNVQKSVVAFIDTKSTTTCANKLNIYISILLFFFFGGQLVSAGTMSFERFSSLMGFIWVLNYSIHGLLFTFTDTAKASVALANVYNILDNASEQKKLQEIHYCPPTHLPSSFQGHVEFKNVSFSYPSRPDAKILMDISFDMKPGQMIALVGESGGGKSTIAGLLCRFYRPTDGGIYLDGLDIHCVPSDVYTRQLSVVDQEPFLFQGTIRDNIAYGLPDEVVSDEEIVRAAKEANAHNFISELSEGYDTVWSPGSNLSGGQRQRIAIARSLVKSPRLLVFDEPTSALDLESEKLVQEALERMMKNRTTLIIAHRLSTIRCADVILFVKGGCITERGTFEELYRKEDGLFRGLVDSSSAFAPADTYTGDV